MLQKQYERGLTVDWEWTHTGKKPRYLAEPKEAKPIEPHAVDNHVNAQGDWVCKTCDELVVLKERPPISPPVLGKDQGPPIKGKAV